MSDAEMMQVLMGETNAEDSLTLETPVATVAPETPVATVAPETPVATVAPETPAVVLAKDGVHTIPFSVVEGLRETVKQQATRIEELQAKGTDATPAPTVSPFADISPEDLVIMREEFPEAVKIMEAQAAKLAELESTVATTREAQERTVAQTVQDTIDTLPKLAHIQATNPELWSRACAMDDVLRTDPNWSSDDKMAARFERVLAGIEAMYGPVALPQAPPDPKAQADAILAAVKPVVPTSLSDLPAGAAPIHDPLGAIASLSPVAQMNKFLGKTPDEIMAMVDQLV